MDTGVEVAGKLVGWETGISVRVGVPGVRFDVSEAAGTAEDDSVDPTVAGTGCVNSAGAEVDTAGAPREQAKIARIRKNPRPKKRHFIVQAPEERRSGGIFLRSHQ